MAQDTMEEEMMKLKETIKKYKEDNEHLTKKLDEAKDALEEERKKTEERTRREEEGKKMDEISKLKEEKRMEEVRKKMKEIVQVNKDLKTEKMALEDKLRLAKKDKKSVDEERRRNEELCNEMKSQEEKLKEMKEMNEQLQESQKLCMDILKGERVGVSSLIKLTETVVDEFQMHVAVSLGDPWLVKQVLRLNKDLLNVKNQRGWTPLNLATARGDVDIMELLWQLDGDLHPSIPLLHVAAANRKHSAAEFLKHKVDNSDTYKNLRACEVARLMGDESLATNIQPLTTLMHRFYNQMMGIEDCLRPCSEHIYELRLFPLVNISRDTTSGSISNTMYDTSPEDMGNQTFHTATWEPLPPEGLPNLGNTCYMNSVMQCLYHATDFSEQLRKLEDDFRQGEVVAATGRVMTAMYHREIPSKDVMMELKKVSGRKDDMYNDFEQKEAQDFMCQMLQWLHEEMALSQEEDEVEGKEVESFISKCFHGTNLTTIACVRKPRTVICSNTEPFSNLSLTITHPTTLKEALVQYYRRQELTWDCDRCRTTHLCEHEVFLRTAPPVLIIHLNRSNELPSSRWKAKVSYSHDLDVKLNTGTSRKYSLFAVCCHSGSMSSGHYTAFCRSGDQWYHFDDTVVIPTHRKNVLNKPSAHILFYEVNNMDSWMVLQSVFAS